MTVMRNRHASDTGVDTRKMHHVPSVLVAFAVLTTSGT
jgi:hypothetical protein